MIISESPSGGLNVFKDAAVVCGMSYVFSRSLERAYAPAPFDPETEYCEEERAGRAIRRTDGQSISFDKTVQPEIVGHITRQVLPLNLMAPNNYFHFLIEWLPSLLARICEGCLPKGVLIATGRLHVNMWEPLQLLTKRWQIPVIQLGVWQGITCDYAIQLRPSYQALELIGGGVRAPAYNAVNLRLLRESLKPFWSAGKHPSRKLFIRRRSEMRHIINAEEIETLATAAGYQVVDPGNLTFMEQIALFSDATHVVGPTGAWVANLACAPDGAKVSVFLPDTLVIPGGKMWVDMGRIFGVDLSEHYCPVPQPHEMVIHSDFVVPSDLASEIFSR